MEKYKDNTIEASGKLPEVLEKLNGWTCIGSGARFFFVGTLEEFRRDAGCIDECMLDDARRLLFHAERKWEECREKLIKAKSEERVETIISAIKKHEGLAMEYQEYIRTFTPIAERKVIRVTKGLLGGGFRIKIEGNEIGKYWTKDEWDRDAKERTKRWERLRS